MLMKNRKLYQMLAVTAGVLLLSGCGASSAQETGITSSDPQEPTTISEETKAPDSTESTDWGMISQPAPPHPIGTNRKP